MKRFLILCSAGFLVATAAWLIGCGGGKSTNKELVPGDTTSAEFQFVSDIVGGNLLGGVERSLDLTFAFWDSIPGATAIARHGNPPHAAQEGEDMVVTSYEYSYENGWHVFAFAAFISDGEDTVEIEGLDSVQFLAADEPVQTPDETVTELVIRTGIGLSVGSGIASMNGEYAINVDNLTPELIDPITVNGSADESASFSFEDSAGSCDLSMTNSIDITNLVAVYGADDCPSAGLINVDASLDLSCLSSGEGDELNIDGDWSVNGEFGEQGATVTYSDGTTYWQVTEDCQDDGGTVAKWNRPLF